MPKVAIITGGDSGIGLAVAKALLDTDAWHVHIIGTNPAKGKRALSILGNNAYFYQEDVTKHPGLAEVFGRIFAREQRINLVFANAGVVDRQQFKSLHSQVSPDLEQQPLALDQYVCDVNFKGVVSTVFLAQYYFATNRTENQSLVITGSCASIWPASFYPLYTASKFAVLGLTMAIASSMYHQHGVQCNIICPGLIRTELLEQERWENFPLQHFTPIEKVTECILALLSGRDMVDGHGRYVRKDDMWGRAVLIFRDECFFMDEPEHCCSGLEDLMAANS